MTDRKISELVAVTTVEDTDEFVLARAGTSNKITGEDLKAAGGSSVRTVARLLTSDEILALADTPKVLVSGVAGVIVLPLLVNVTTGVGTAYTVPDLVHLVLGASDAAAAVLFTDFVDTAQYALANGVQTVRGVSPAELTGGSDNAFDVRGAPLILQVAAGGQNPTGGTLDAVVTVLYALMADTV